MAWKRNVEGMKNHAHHRAQKTRERVDQAITMLVRECKPINFNTVATAAGVTKSYLYTQSDLRLMKVNYFPHQMAITLAENGSLVKNQKS